MPAIAQTYLSLPSRNRSLMTGRPTRAHLRAASVAVAVLTVAAVLALPIAQDAWTTLPGFVPATGAATAIIDLMVACLLLGQARVARAGMPLRLAGAYIFATAAILPHLLAFPGGMAAVPLLGNGSDSVWLWNLWHGGYALAICWYAWRSDGSTAPRPGMDAARLFAAIGIPLAAVAMCLLLIHVHPIRPFSPASWAPSDWGDVLRSLAGPTVLLLNLAGLAGVALRLRGQTTVHLWLAVAMFASLIDVGLTLAGREPFTAGWYFGRVAALLTSVLMLTALISEIIGLYADLARDNLRLETQAQTDALTRLANRRCFDMRLDQEWRRACRDRTNLSLMLIDVDQFKQYNDRYGHPAGDACLRRVARCIRDHVWRAADLAARYGGEEFAVLLPVTDLDGALAVAEWIRCGVHALGMPHASSLTGALTVSIGVASMNPLLGGVPSSHLLDAADQALYRAKALGRDRVEYAEEGVAVTQHTHAE